MYVKQIFYSPCSISNVLHFTTAAAVPCNSGVGGISGLNLSTNNGLDLSLPNYEGLDLSSVTNSANANANTAATPLTIGGTTKRQQRHVQQQQQQQQPGQQLVGFLLMLNRTLGNGSIHSLVAYFIGPIP